MHAEVVDQLGDLDVDRTGRDVDGGSVGACTAVDQDEHVIGDGEGVGRVVGDHDRHRAGRSLQLTHHLADGETVAAVEVGEGLVEEDEIWRADEGAADGGAAAFAGGKGGRFARE